MGRGVADFDQFQQTRRFPVLDGLRALAVGNSQYARYLQCLSDAMPPRLAKPRTRLAG